MLRPTFGSDYLLDSTVSELETFLKNGWITTQSFDIMVQQLQFEKTQPAAAREGRSVVQAAAGVPVPQDRLRQLQEERAATSRFNLPFHHSKSGGSDTGRSSSDSNGGGGARDYGHGHAAIEDRPRPNAPLFRTAVAVETFDPEDAGDLPLRPGDVVEVLSDGERVLHPLGKLHLAVFHHLLLNAANIALYAIHERRLLVFFAFHPDAASGGRTFRVAFYVLYIAYCANAVGQAVVTAATATRPRPEASPSPAPI
ncbi:hypothetical protein HK405_007254 [Cladochytrium tenue]|nr:hypothetical protein HK405_007254 [Cladochytrium tenue]